MATDRRLEDRVAVVTGSGSGIGRGSAIVLARAGARIIVNDIDPDGGAETVSLIREAGGEATFIAAR
jgi:NAD(P)-dependent dehydrogenase (short-subunit alcohol dehydrogenase family)